MKNRLLRFTTFLGLRYQELVRAQAIEYKVFNQIEINAITSLNHGVRNALKPLAYIKLLAMYISAACKQLLRKTTPNEQEGKEAPTEVVQAPKA